MQYKSFANRGQKNIKQISFKQNGGLLLKSQKNAPLSRLIVWLCMQWDRLSAPERTQTHILCHICLMVIGRLVNVVVRLLFG